MQHDNHDDESEASIDALAARDREPDARYSDAGNALRFVAMHRERLRYCAAWMTWLVWDGRRWRRDSTGVEIEAAKAVAADLHRRAAELHGRAAAGDSSASGEAEMLAKHARRSESGRAIRDMAALAKSDPAIAATPDMFDRDPWLLNVNNGTINLRTGSLRPHRREDMITCLAPVDFDPSAECPVFLATVERALPDPEVRSFFQRWNGYCLTGDVSEQRLVQPHGNGGNSKSTLIRVQQDLLGDYAVQSPAELVVTDRRGDDRGRRARAALRGKRLAVCAEVEADRYIDEPQVKALTGGDKITGALLYQNEFEFVPTAKITIATNHRLRVRGQDDGIWRRILLVPFTVQIPEAERDPNLFAKLMAEASGILAWMVRGCLAWQARRLDPPPAVVKATEAYRHEEDRLAEFLEIFTERDTDGAIPTAVLYQLHRKWSAERDESPLSSPTALTRQLKGRGIMVDRDRFDGRQARAVLGLRLRSGAA